MRIVKQTKCHSLVTKNDNVVLNNQTILNYKGPIEFEVVETLLQKVKGDLEKHDIKKVLKKRVYNVIVECVENMLKHTTKTANSNLHPYILLEKGQQSFQIITGNLIANAEVKSLTTRLDQVNKLDAEGLKAFYEKQITREDIFQQEGAGLGIITIAQKSNSQIDYTFTKVDDELSVFEIRVTIPFHPEQPHTK